MPPQQRLSWSKWSKSPKRPGDPSFLSLLWRNYGKGIKVTERNTKHNDLHPQGPYAKKAAILTKYLSVVAEGNAWIVRHSFSHALSQSCGGAGPI